MSAVCHTTNGPNLRPNGPLLMVSDIAGGPEGDGGISRTPSTKTGAQSFKQIEVVVEFRCLSSAGVPTPQVFNNNQN